MIPLRVHAHPTPAAAAQHRLTRTIVSAGKKAPKVRARYAPASTSPNAIAAAVAIAAARSGSCPIDSAEWIANQLPAAAAASVMTPMMVVGQVRPELLMIVPAMVN